MPITTVPVIEPLEIHGPPHIEVDRYIPDHNTITDTIINLTPEQIEETVFTLPNARPPVFNLQISTADTAIRELNDQQPREILRTDFSQKAYRALSTDYRLVRAHIDQFRKLQIAQTIADSLLPKEKYIFVNQLLEDKFSSREISAYILGERPVSDSNAYTSLMDQLNHFGVMRKAFFEQKKEFAPIQAQYHQQLALIRQRPIQISTINAQDILEAVHNWSNIWGISIRISADDELEIRLGLCNIRMNDSARETVYDDPQEILLAPFYITIRLKENGRFSVPSERCRGLSMNDGAVEYNFHPHQLSDQPCFGTFAQTMNDLAATGEIVALISTLIAFYSQYNSEDSAGVSARNYHPSILSIFESDEYYAGVIDSLIVGARYKHYDEQKLNDAIGAYREYWVEHHEYAAPMVESRLRCVHCEENLVTDDDCFYVTVSDDRICEPCWEHNYCSECERHEEDCICGPDDY